MSEALSFEETTAILESFTGLSPEALRIVKLLSQLPSKLADPAVRSEVRMFLLLCLDAGVDPIGVERARAVLAAYEGVLGSDGGERVRVVG